MSTLAEIVGKTQKTINSGTPCSFAEGMGVLRETDEGVYKDIEAWLEGDRPLFTDADIKTVFNHYEIEVARTTIPRHRLGKCRCFK